MGKTLEATEIWFLRTILKVSGISTLRIGKFWTDLEQTANQSNSESGKSDEVNLEIMPDFRQGTLKYTVQ